MPSTADRRKEGRKEGRKTHCLVRSPTPSSQHISHVDPPASPARMCSSAHMYVRAHVCRVPPSFVAVSLLPPLQLA